MRAFLLCHTVWSMNLNFVDANMHMYVNKKYVCNQWFNDCEYSNSFYRSFTTSTACSSSTFCHCLWLLLPLFNVPLIILLHLLHLTIRYYFYKTYYNYYISTTLTTLDTSTACTVAVPITTMYEVLVRQNYILLPLQWTAPSSLSHLRPLRLLPQGWSWIYSNMNNIIAVVVVWNVNVHVFRMWPVLNFVYKRMIRYEILTSSDVSLCTLTNDSFSTISHDLMFYSFSSLYICT